MNAVLTVQAIAGTIYLLTVSIVGIRLLLLARRTRELPEFLLGAALLLGGTFGGPLEAAGSAMRAEVGPEVAGKLLLVGNIFGMIALAFHCVFIARVFRPSEAWARWLAGAIVVCPLAAIFGSAASGTFSNGEAPMFWFWIAQLGRVGASCWLVVEGGRYYGMMKRRLQLGLADPMVTDRFLLWTIAGVAAIVLMLTAVPPMILDPVRDAVLLSLDLVVFSIAGVTVSTLYFLTFLPPEAYRRRFDVPQRAATEA